MAKVAVVTGASQGLGLALVRGLCRRLTGGLALPLGNPVEVGYVVKEEDGRTHRELQCRKVQRQPRRNQPRTTVRAPRTSSLAPG